MPAPLNDGGRRSRRGFAYQDAVTLLDCLDMNDGHFDEVGFEDLDDIVCMAGTSAKFRQVKTKEDGTRHSISTICAPERKGKPETSIIGRLFMGKPLADDSAFCLLLNETPGQDLAAFRILRGETQGQVSEKAKTDIVERLAGLVLPAGFTTEWCVNRFEVLVEARQIDEVEAILCRRLVKPVTKILGQQPLPSEIDAILVRLGRLVARQAQAVVPQRWNASQFAKMLEEEVARITGRRVDGSTTPLPSLAEKLAPAGVPEDECDAQTEAMLGYRRRYRNAIGQERAHFNDLNDYVFTICVDISAQRRAGMIPEGRSAYAATLLAVKQIDVPGSVISLPDKLAALSDVTARCQNRYSDDS